MDFSYGNKVINASGPIKPSDRNMPADPRTRVETYADIASIPTPYVGMLITVLTDETNSSKMTDYKVKSLKANSFGVANSLVDEVVRYVDYLGVASGGGSSSGGANVEIVNDLTTGGIDKALSAEQGKVIKSSLDDIKTQKYDDVSISGNSLQFKSNGINKKIIPLPNSDGTINTSIDVLGNLLYQNDNRSIIDIKQKKGDGGFVVFVDDDSSIQCYEKLAPLFDKYNKKFTTAVTTSYLGQNNVGPDNLNYMSIEHLFDLRSRGYDIASHSNTHRATTGLTEDEQLSEFIESKKTLLRNGIEPSCYVFPYNQIATWSSDNVLKYYRAGVGGGNSTNSPGYIKFNTLTRIGLGAYQTSTTESLKNIALNTKTNNNICIFMVHAWYTNKTDYPTAGIADEGNLEAIESVLKYCVENDIEILTMREALNRMYPIVDIRLGDRYFVITSKGVLTTNMITGETISVDSISLNKTKTTINTGSSEKLIATINPYYATNTGVKWTSDNTEIATVDPDNGTVNAVSQGSCTINAKALGGNRQANCVVTVEGEATNVPVNSVSLNINNATVNIKGEITLTASFTPTNPTNKNVTWTVNNSNVKIVQTGLSCVVTGLSLGEAVITVTAEDGNHTDTCTVNVTNNIVSIDSIVLNKQTSVLNVNDTEQLNVIFTPTDPTNKNVRWEVNNSNVLEVSQTGLVTAKSTGEAVVTVTTEDGNHTATCNYTVNNNQPIALLFEQPLFTSLSTTNNPTIVDDTTVTFTLTNQTVGAVNPTVDSLVKLTGLQQGKAIYCCCDSVESSTGSFENLGICFKMFENTNATQAKGSVDFYCSTIEKNTGYIPRVDDVWVHFKIRSNASNGYPVTLKIKGFKLYQKNE